MGFDVSCSDEGMKKNMLETCVCVCVQRGDGRGFLTPDVTEGVVRPAELQQAAVCVQFTDERQHTEKQPVCSFFLLLLLDLEDHILNEFSACAPSSPPPTPETADGLTSS